MLTRMVGMAVGLALLLAVASAAQAERCIGPKENTVAIGYGVDPVNAADITWCDDFDSYCGANCGECETGDATSVWPGYPPVEDNVCTDPLDFDESFFRKPYHWPQVSVTNPLPISSAAPTNGPARWEGWDYNAGWTSEPYTLLYQGGSNTNAYHTFNLEGAAAHKSAGMNALNGTDENPLVLRFWLNPAEGSAVMNPKPPETAPNVPLYVELRMEGDHAPTDWTEKNCAPEGQGPYPAICQQRFVPAGCPVRSTEVHSSMAFGWLSLVDNNPCDVENGRKPTSYHASVFDGVKWTEMRNNMFVGQVGGFNWDTGQAYFEMKVKTNVVEIKLIAYVEAWSYIPPDTYERVFELKTSTATVPRLYTGAFNRISIGAAPGCKLDSVTGECVTEPDVWRYMTNHADQGWSPMYAESVKLLGGIPTTVNGACCMSDGTCSDVTETACTAAGGVFRGVDTSCENGDCLGACCQPLGVCTETTSTECPGAFRGFGTSCEDPDVCPCPVPFGDLDLDGDMDMTDFARLQRCLGPVAQGCACFDKNTDGTIDQDDVEAFATCANGPDVTATCP